MNAWEDLVSTALLGTRRRTTDLATLPPAVRAQVPAREDPAESLLATAALLTNYRRAGRLPLAGTHPMPAAALDERPLIRPAARERLARLLTANRPELLEEWLGAAAQAGLRVPPERLPALADAARARTSLRAPLMAVSGPAGGWLGTHNPEWRFLASSVPAGDADVWRYGNLVQRREWLKQTLSDDPAGARAALSAAWRGEPAEVRAGFLSLLGEHLDAEDEPFLEAALDDRAASVRQQATDLLSGLPGAALGRRMTARLRPLIQVRKRALRPDVLELTLPDAAEPALARDGIRVPPGAEQRTGLLRQIVAATPLEFWAEFGLPPGVLRMPVEGCPAGVLRESWAAAAVRQRDEGWARALLAADPGGRGTAALVGALERGARAEAVLELAGQVNAETVARLVLELPAPWPPELGSALLRWVTAQGDQRVVAHAAVVIARTVPPGCLGDPAAVAPLPEDAAHWRRTLTETLTFRREMYEELR